MKCKLGRKLLSFLLTLAMIVGLMPGMSLTAYADGETETATLPTSSGNYILTADVTVNSAWHPVDGITLNLGGHIITQTGTNHSDGSVIVIDSGRTFTMTGTGTLTGGIGSNEGTYYVGGGVMVLGTFNMRGGTITGNSVDGNGAEGGGVWVGNGGTFNMYDGAITNNTGAGGGVGIGVDGWCNGKEPGTFNMYGGSISGNSSSYAAGVRLNNGTFNMQGGTITGGGSNFDIRVDKDGASLNVFNLSGNVTIGSIRFDGDMKANIAGSITNDSAIIVYMDTARVFTNSSIVAYNEAGRFTSGMDNYVVLKNSDGQLYLGNETNYAMSFDRNGGSGNMTTEYVVAGGTYSLPNCRFTAPANMTFKAWSYNGTEYDAGQSFTNVSGNMTFTAVWKNTALPYVVTYKVENGTWADGTTTDQTETVTSGSNPANVPTGMKATEGYTGGAWNTDPTTATITEATTFTYTFDAESAAGDNNNNNNDDDDDDDDNNQPSSPQLIHYQEVGIPNGIVRDITGTREATAESNPFQTAIANSSELESLLNISADQKSQGVNVWLEITDAGATMPEEDKTLIQNAKGDYQVGMLMDVSMFQKVGANETQRITQTNGKVKVSIVIPENLRAAGRTYAIIRVHNGQTTVIPGTYDENTHIFSFETDQFSSYAIVYTGNAVTSTAPKTGDSADFRVWYLLLFVSILALGIVLGRARKYEK